MCPQKLSFNSISEEGDEKTLRRRIETLLKEANIQQLRQIQRVLRALLEL